MKKIFKIVDKLNTQQKFISAIVLPFVLFLLTFAIAGEGEYYEDAFDLSDTWYIWAICFFIIGFLEVLLIDENYNKIQKTVFAIVIPLELFFLFYIMARGDREAFNLSRHWDTWFSYLVIVGVIEFILFKDKGKIN